LSIQKRVPVRAELVEAREAFAPCDRLRANGWFAFPGLRSGRTERFEWLHLFIEDGEEVYTARDCSICPWRMV